MLQTQHFSTSIASQQIISGKLLLVVIGGQKSNLSCEIEIRTNNNLLPMIYCENVVDLTLLYYDSFTLMKLYTSKIANFIQPRPILQRLVSTNFILVCCHSRIANVQYSQKQYIRIFAHDKQYICVIISPRKSFLHLIIPQWDSSKKTFYLYISQVSAPLSQPKKNVLKRRESFSNNLQRI